MEARAWGGRSAGACARVQLLFFPSAAGCDNPKLSACAPAMPVPVCMGHAAQPKPHLRQEAADKAPRQPRQQQHAAQHGDAGARVGGGHLRRLPAAFAGHGGRRLARRRRQAPVQAVSPLFQHARHVVSISQKVGHRQLQARHISGGTGGGAGREELDAAACRVTGRRGQPAVRHSSPPPSHPPTVQHNAQYTHTHTHTHTAPPPHLPNTHTSIQRLPPHPHPPPPLP